MSAIEDAEASVLQGDGPDPTVQESWRVTDERSAEHALLRIRMARKDARYRTATARELLNAHLARANELQAFIDGETKKADDTAGHFEALLITWHKSRYADDPKHNVSIALGGGLLKSHAGRDRVEVDDADAVYAYAVESGGHYATLVTKVDKRDLLAHVKTTGEVPEGARLIRATDDDRSWSVVL